MTILLKFRIGENAEFTSVVLVFKFIFQRYINPDISYGGQPGLGQSTANRVINLSLNLIKWIRAKQNSQGWIRNAVPAVHVAQYVSSSRREGYHFMLLLSQH